MENKTENDIQSIPINRNRNEEARKILNYNRKRLYKIPKKYAELQEVLTPPLYEFLLDIISFWLKVDCISYGSHDMVYFLGTQKATYKVRKKTTKGVTNRYINYLSAIGLLKKIEQVIVYDDKRRFFRKNVISKVNINLLKYDTNYSKQPLNTFELTKYTTHLLDICNQRAKRLLKANITTGNISYNQLAINGLEDIAKEIYLQSRDLSVEKKEKEYNILIQCMDFFIQKQGYTTKQEIYKNCPFPQNEIDKIFKIFKNDILAKYTYKPPNKEEKKEYGLTGDKWIIIKKISSTE